MTDHDKDDGFRGAKKRHFYIVVGAALVVMLVFLVLNLLGHWEHRTFDEIWAPPSETMR